MYLYSSFANVLYRENKRRERERLDDENGRPEFSPDAASIKHCTSSLQKPLIINGTPISRAVCLCCYNLYVRLELCTSSRAREALHLNALTTRAYYILPRCCWLSHILSNYPGLSHKNCVCLFNFPAHRALSPRAIGYYRKYSSHSTVCTWKIRLRRLCCITMAPSGTALPMVFFPQFN